MDPNQTGPTDPNAPIATPGAPALNPIPEPTPLGINQAPIPPSSGLPNTPPASPLPETNPQPLNTSAPVDPFGSQPTMPSAAIPSNPNPFGTAPSSTPNPTTPNPASAGPDTPPSWDTLGSSPTTPLTSSQAMPTAGGPAPTNPFQSTPSPEPFPNPSPNPAGPPPWSGGDLGATVTHQEPPEPAPTDLSQLSNLGGESPAFTPPVSTPETVVVPPTNPVPNAGIAEPHKRLPKGLIIGGIVILILVIVASAYFILGIGKPGEPQPSSLPAQQQLPLTNPPKPVTQTTTNTATGSSTFGSLGNTPATASGQSALDLLRARQATASGTAQ